MASFGVRSLVLFKIISLTLFFEKIGIVNGAPSVDRDFDNYNGNRALLRLINPLRPTYNRGIDMETNTGLMQYINNSMQMMDHDGVSIFTTSAQVEEHNANRHAHYRYIYKRIKDIAVLHSEAEYTPWHIPMNNRIFYVKHFHNNTIYYHVECPNFSVNIDIIFSGKKYKIHSVRDKCEYFRWIVRKAIGIFNEDGMFKFIELPSEVMDNNIFVKYGGEKVLLDYVLNFAFVNSTHNLFYYRERQFKCDNLMDNKDGISVAHLSGSSVHINNSPNYCITDVAYDKKNLAQQFNCSYDLFFVLVHELAHYFISECHINIPLLKTFTMERKLNARSLELMKNTWDNANPQMHCYYDLSQNIKPIINTTGKNNKIYQMFFDTHKNRVVFEVIGNISGKILKAKNLIRFYYDRDMGKIKLAGSKFLHFTKFENIYIDQKNITIQIPIL